MFMCRNAIRVLSALICLAVPPGAQAARILDTRVEMSDDATSHRVEVALYFEFGEAAVELEVLAWLLNDGADPPLRPIASNNPSARANNGQYAVRTTVLQENQDRVQTLSLAVPLDHLQLAEGFHQIVYEARTLADGKPTGSTSTSPEMLNVSQIARVTGTTTERVTIYGVKSERREQRVPVEENGRTGSESIAYDARVPYAQRVERRLPQVQSGAYGAVHAYAETPEVRVDDPNIAEDVSRAVAERWAALRKLKVGFATTRNVANSAATDSSRYGNLIAPLSYGTATVNILAKNSRAERPAGREPPQPTPSECFTVDPVEATSEDVFFRAISRRLWQGPDAMERTKNDIMLYVHGFNNSFRFSCVRLAQFAYDIRFAGQPVLFSWPSNGGDSITNELLGMTTYQDDRADADRSVDSLAQVLREIVADRGKPDSAAAARGEIHLIAHSLGNQVLLDALDKLHREWPADLRPFTHIILAAPDVASDDCIRMAPALTQRAERVTLYFCSEDWALAVSRNIHEQPRAGLEVVVVDDVDNVDADLANTTWLGHSYFVYESLVLRDLEDVLVHGRFPEMRLLCPRIKVPDAYRYWAIPDATGSCAQPPPKTRQ